MKKKKINLKIIVSILIVVIFYQFLSLILSNAPLSRHPVDKLVYNLEHSDEISKYVILGDSITRDVLNRYKGNDKKIINLTVDEPAGVLGSYFLLNRYLHKNNLESEIKHVFFAGTPEFFINLQKGHSLRNELYLNTIFKNENEVKLLNKLNILPKSYNKIEKIKNYFNFNKNILQPIYGLLKNDKNTILTNGYNIDNEKIIRYSEQNLIGQKILDKRSNVDFFISKEDIFVLNKLCELSNNYKFKLHIILAPTQSSVYKNWKNNGKIQKLINIFTKNNLLTCESLLFVDLNNIKSFPDYAFRDKYHLKILNWSKLYVKILYGYIDEF